GRAPADFDPRELRRDAPALGQAVILGPIRAVARVVLRVDYLDARSGFETKAIAFDALRDDRWAADENRLRQPFVDDDLHGAQHALVLAFRVNDALGRFLRRLKDRLHQQARVI